MKQIIKKGQVYAKKNPKKVLAALGFLFVIGILIYMLQPEPEKPKPKSRRPITRVRQTAVEVDDDDDVIPRSFGRRPVATRLAGGRGGGGSSSVTTRSSGTTTRSSSGTTTRSSGSSGTTTSDGDETTPNDEEEDIDNGDGDETTPNDEEIDISDLNGYWMMIQNQELLEENLENSQGLILFISHGKVDIYYQPPRDYIHQDPFVAKVFQSTIDQYSNNVFLSISDLIAGKDNILELQPPFYNDEIYLKDTTSPTRPRLVMVRLDNPDPYLDRSFIVNYETKINSLEQLNGSWNLESVPYSEIKEPVDDIFEKILGIQNGEANILDSGPDRLGEKVWGRSGQPLTRVDIQLNNDRTSLVISYHFETVLTDGSPGGRRHLDGRREYRTIIYADSTIVLFPDSGPDAGDMFVIFEYDTSIYWLMIKHSTKDGGFEIIIYKLIREDIDTGEGIDNMEDSHLQKRFDQTSEPPIQFMGNTNTGNSSMSISIDLMKKPKNNNLNYSDILKQAWEQCKQNFLFRSKPMGYSKEECQKLSDNEYNELQMLISENKKELSNLLPHLDFNIQNINDFRSFKNNLSQADIDKLDDINSRIWDQRRIQMLEDELSKAGLEVDPRDLMDPEKLEQFVNTLNWREQQIFRRVSKALK